jgi:hypothetical protein
MPDGTEDWDDSPFAGWSEAVQTWPWEEWNEGGGRQEGWVKSGPCPRCGHTIAIYQEIVVYINPPPAGYVEYVDACCNCGFKHTGRAPDAPCEGCGPSARIKAR